MHRDIRGSDRRGTLSLTWVIALSGVATAFAVGSAGAIAPFAREARGRGPALQATALAESGLLLARQALGRGEDPTTPGELPLGDGWVSVQLERRGPGVVVTATGIAPAPRLSGPQGRVVRRVVAELIPGTPGADGLPAVAAWKEGRP